jgi:gas vesicle protein
MKRYERNVGLLLAGLALGGLVGSASGLLFAPQSGKRTRELLRDKGFQFKDQVEQKAADMRDNAEQVTQRALDQAERARTQGERLVKEKKAQLERGMPKGFGDTTP